MKEVQEYLKVNSKQKKGKARLRLVEFIDNGYYIVYIPSLKLSAYGNSKQEAREMMGDVVLDDFFENLTAQPEIVALEFLKELGWKKSPIFPKELSFATHVDTDGILKNFNLSESTKITETLVEV